MGNILKLTTLAFLLIGLSFPISSFAQLVVDDTYTPEALAESLVGAGVSVSNVVINCPSGGFGRFDGTMTTLPIDSGVILCSGSIFDAVGPNADPGAGTDNAAPGDPDLDLIPGVLGTNDACVLEFDVDVISDTLSFNYIFGSEEYLEFVGSFNDVFAFYISGPGITGTQNIALVPGTSTAVSINNVNDASFPAFYTDNGDGFTPPFSTDPMYIQYDGMTTALEARAAVIPCQTYHLKLAIADDLDWVYDSGVFIEAGSLTSFGVSLSQSTSVGFGFSNAIEGCVDGIITFTRSIVTSDGVWVNYVVGGDATNGVDYATILDSIYIPGGAASADLVISPTVDGLPEGIENVKIYLQSLCDSSIIDSVVLGIQDEILLDVSTGADTAICPGAAVELVATGGLLYNWSPAGTLSDPGSDTTIATPSTTTTYTVVTTVGTCSDSTSTTVNVMPPIPVDAGTDVEICIGESIGLGASGGLSYSWSPSATLDDGTISNPTATPTTTTTYTVTAFDSLGCTADADVTVIVNPLPTVDAGADFTACAGDMITLDASGGVTYSWSPAGDLSDPNISNPVLTVTATPSTYTVTVTDANGCVNTDEIFVDVDDFPTVDAGPDTVVFLGESVTLMGSSDGDVTWSPTTGLDDPTVLNPNASPDVATWYVLTAVSEFGCVSIDSVLITVLYDPIVAFPTAFSPNGDNQNDQFGAIVRGPVDIEAYRIFNRWGQLVFEGNTPTDAWDGFFNGRLQDIGTYVYHFRGVAPDGEVLELKGNFTLIR